MTKKQADKGGKNMEQINRKSGNIDMLGKIYDARLEELQEESKIDRAKLKNELNGVKLEEIEKTIKGLNSDICEKEKIMEDIQKLVEDYEIQIAYYSEKNYKIGFKDAFSLWRQCENE